MTLEHALIFGGVCVVTWYLFIYFWPRMIGSIFKRAILGKGFGEGPVPINTLYTTPQKQFTDPIAWQSTSGSNSVTAGMNRDTLITIGCLDLSIEAQVLHVPEMAGRYYSVQFNDPSNNTNFAYVGKRATGTQAGDYLITGPGWKAQAPSGMKQISSPNKSVILIGRVFVENDSDVATAYALAKQIQLTPLGQWKPG
jgi:hypothetical protein